MRRLGISIATVAALAATTLVLGCPGSGSDCTPKCDGRQCGADGCGGSCGTCSGDGAQCLEGSGQCCVPTCEGRECGDDGCGGSCGECTRAGSMCNPKKFKCIGGCEPTCEGRECGDDGCGGTCPGTCAEGLECNAVGKCAPPCAKQCGGKQCGADGCGGSCGACGEGQACENDRCVTGPTCFDGKLNGSESDVDCGGQCEAKCLVGKTCGSASDCKSGVCDGGKCGIPLTCSNNTKDAGETDVDCGGQCDGCPIDKNCKVHADCLSLSCQYGVCKEPTCDDGSKNQNETDVDCGGKCEQKCPDGKVCQSSSDCASTRCEDGLCASCNDGKLNGTEVDIDCGGSCPRCADGRKCQNGYDCLGNGCENGTCCQANECGICGPTTTEVCNGKDDDCSGETDDNLGEGEPCPLQQGICAGARMVCRGAKGWQCDAEVYQAHHYQYSAKEDCTDGVDNNCNGKTDWDDTADCCQPKCDGKDCGDNGCGGQCGTCDSNQQCTAKGQCIYQCGSVADSCKNRCDQQWSSQGGFQCLAFQCLQDLSYCAKDWEACCGNCTPQCTGKQCGPDGCGGQCGTCADGKTCDEGTGQCVSACGKLSGGTCQGYCGLAWNGGFECNCDGSGTPCADYSACCGACGCGNKKCGDDGCGGSCGECIAGYSCLAGNCVKDSTGCGSITGVGCCTADGKNKYCVQGGTVQVDNCGGASSCGWDAGQDPAGYYCGSGLPASDPSGVNPRLCP